jgi:hypothetical protein
VHSVSGKINYGGLKHNSLYLGLVLPSGGSQSLIGAPPTEINTFVDGGTWNPDILLAE